MTLRYRMPITAGPADIDEVGHVSNLVYVRWVQEVAMAHSQSLGWDYANYRAFGAVFMVRRHEIDYVAQVNLGEALVAETWVEGWRMASCTRKTELTRADKVVARASTTWALISLGTGRPVRIPDEIRALFEV